MRLLPRFFSDLPVLRQTGFFRINPFVSLIRDFSSNLMGSAPDHWTTNSGNTQKQNIKKFGIKKLGTSIKRASDYKFYGFVKYLWRYLFIKEPQNLKFDKQFLLLSSRNGWFQSTKLSYCTVHYLSSAGQYINLSNIERKYTYFGTARIEPRAAG